MFCRNEQTIVASLTRSGEPNYRIERKRGFILNSMSEQMKTFQNIAAKCSIEIIIAYVLENCYFFLGL
jgi:hypothetical protein